MWVCLNDAGMRVWGDVFPAGKVPVASMAFQEAKLGPKTERVVLVAWTVLSEEQKDAVLAKISERCGAPKEAILKDILKVGLPLRESYTTGTVAAELRFFI
ncbi:MAG TPA: hypothetical protein VI864_02720 [Candidatus Bathyarchaeia archaeon]|nr:hypothetical protein [Candidatus Bathyarchaeia archaeon]